MPPGKEKRLSLVLMFGADGHALLRDIFAEDVPAWLRQAHAIETLRRVWISYIMFKAALSPGGRVEEKEYLNEIIASTHHLIWVLISPGNAPHTGSATKSH